MENVNRLWGAYLAERSFGYDAQRAFNNAKRRPNVEKFYYRNPRAKRVWHNSKGEFIAVESGDFGLRFIGFVNIERGNYWGDESGGYYSDSYQEARNVGCVWQLPGCNGLARFVSGYYETESGNYILDVSQIYFDSAPQGEYWVGVLDNDAAKDAAHSADEFARISAEHAREYSEAWDAGINFDNLTGLIEDYKSELRAIFYERRAINKAHFDAPALCGAIKTRVIDLLEQIKDARKERADLLGSWDYNQNARDGFKAGAGLD